MNKQQYLLVKLMEECAEVQQACSKALIFGLDDQWKNEHSNSQKLTQEMGDLMGVWNMLLVQEADVEIGGYTMEMLLAKQEKINEFMQYSKERGTLKD